MINYFYEWESDFAFKSDTKNQKYFAKKSKQTEVEIDFEDNDFQRAIMSGDKIDEKKYKDF